MAYSCEIMADSIGPNGDRLTTFKLTYPRIIHAEMLRHRMLSRNVASSRAIPFEKMVKDVEEDPFIPIAWQKTHKGMQGTKYIENEYTINHTNPGDNDLDKCIEEWLYARNGAILQAKELNHLGVTKQPCNRLLEPYVWTTELVSGTEWENFFKLRCPKYYGVYRSQKDLFNGRDVEKRRKAIHDINNESQAEIHIQKIAEMMWDAMNESTPKELKSGEFHVPFIEIEEDSGITK